MDPKRSNAELPIGPGAVCEHDGPASVSAVLGGYCARCRALGPVREDPDGARLALLECGPASRSEEGHYRPRQEASHPRRGPAPGDGVEPGTQGTAEELVVSRPRSLPGWLGDPWTRRR